MQVRYDTLSKAWVLYITFKHSLYFKQGTLLFYVTSTRTNQLFWLKMMCHLPLQALSRYFCWYGLASNMFFAFSTGNQDLVRSVSKGKGERKIILFDKLSIDTQLSRISNSTPNQKCQYRVLAKKNSMPAEIFIVLFTSLSEVFLPQQFELCIQGCAVSPWVIFSRYRQVQFKSQTKDDSAHWFFFYFCDALYCS